MICIPSEKNILIHNQQEITAVDDYGAFQLWANLLIQHLRSLSSAPPPKNPVLPTIGPNGRVYAIEAEPSTYLRLCGTIAINSLANVIPFYRNPKGAGRRPIGVARMLRIYFLQHWFNLSDPAAEEAIYDSRAMRTFIGIDLGQEPAPDETTICKFRHSMEIHHLGDRELSPSQQVSARKWYADQSWHHC